ncbi:MAG TPA: Na+/H+ antiporter subunit E [Burkholderiales bacterium]
MKHPLLAALLVVTWLLLNRTLAPGQILLGAVLAGAASAAFARLGPHARPARLGLAAWLIVLVLADIVRSNIAVARIVFFPARPERRAGFLPIPLATRHPGALAALAVIVTATPGTSWAGYDAERGVMTLHVLDLKDEEGMVRTFKLRYEARLREIFE